MQIGYLDEPLEEYRRAVDSCASLPALRAALKKFRRIANDAYEVAQRMTASDMREFRKGLKLERRGKYAGDVWASKFSAIALPELTLHVSIIADRYKVPWGCAFIRAKEAGVITEHDGVAVFQGKNEEAPCATTNG